MPRFIPRQKVARYVVVRNALPDWVPAWIRRWIGEEHMGLDVYPLWVWEPRGAELFYSAQAAQAYIFNTAGARRNGFENARVRRVVFIVQEGEMPTLPPGGTP